MTTQAGTQTYLSYTTYALGSLALSAESVPLRIPVLVSEVVEWPDERWTPMQNVSKYHVYNTKPRLIYSLRPTLYFLPLFWWRWPRLSKHMDMESCSRGDEESFDVARLPLYEVKEIFSFPHITHAH